jgi:conjugal transfer pilin signal peptidase TrbI
VAGQAVLVHDNAIWIDGQYWGRFWIAPWIMQKHIPVDAPWFQGGHAVDGTWVIPSGEVLLLGTEPYSFDGRYWGFLKDSNIGMMATAI